MTVEQTATLGEFLLSPLVWKGSGTQRNCPEQPVTSVGFELGPQDIVTAALKLDTFAVKA